MLNLLVVGNYKNVRRQQLERMEQMKFTKIITNSKWKQNLKHEYIVQDSDTLLVILAGNAYE